MKFEMINFVFLAMGIFLTVVGIMIWAGRKVEFIHGENWEKIRTEDIIPYTRNMGIGVILLSLSLLTLGVLSAFETVPKLVQWIGVAIFGGAGALLMIISYKKYFQKDE